MNLTGDEQRALAVSAMGPSLGNTYYLLSQDAQWVHIHWSEYHEFYGVGEEVISVLKRTAPSFFSRLQKTMWRDVLMRISRLTDPISVGNKRNLSIAILPGLVQDAELRESVDTEVRQAVLLAKFARDIRNRRLAHTDLDYAEKPEIRPLAKASVDKIDAVLAAIGKVLNTVQLHFLDSTTSYGSPILNRGVRELLYHLRRSDEL